MLTVWRLLKLQRFITFSEFLVGFFVSVPSSAYVEQIRPLVLTFISFQVLLYGGIYIMNDLANLQSDRKHPKKKLRPIARGKVRLEAARAVAILLVVSALLVGAFVDVRVVLFDLAFLCLNLLYTHGFRQVPYLDLLGNVLTHPLRVVFAFALFGWPEQDSWVIVACVFLLYLALIGLRRHKELVEVGDHLREALKGYSARLLLTTVMLSGAGLCSLVAFTSCTETVWIALLACSVYLAFAIGYVTPSSWLGWLVDYTLTH
jgi:4-hydroxybenzoate polyprenyltransferase